MLFFNYSSVYVETKQHEHCPLASDNWAEFHNEASSIMGEAGGQTEAHKEVHNHDE